MRSRSRRSQCIHRPRSHAARGSKTRRTATAPRKRWATAPSRPCSLRRLWHCQITTMQPMDSAFATAILHSVNFVVGDAFRDRRQPGHQNAAPGGAAADQQPQSLQPVQAATRRVSPSLRDGTPAMRGLSIRYGLGRKPRRSHERSPVLGSPQSYRFRLLFAEIPKGTDRNSELKLRLHVSDTGQISDLICGKRASVLTARGSISKVMKGLVGGAAQGSADCRRKWTTALIPPN